MERAVQERIHALETGLRSLTLPPAAVVRARGGYREGRLSQVLMTASAILRSTARTGQRRTRRRGPEDGR